MTAQLRVPAADVPEGEARRYPVDGQQVAVVNLGEKGFRAVDAVCSHAHYFLDEGEVDVEERPSSARSTARPSTSTRGGPARCRRPSRWRPSPSRSDGDDILIEVTTA